MAFLNNTGLERLWSKITSKLDTKVDKVSGKGLSTNDYTTTEKNKLAGIAAGAQVNTVTGIKGNAESSYRTGNVNITPDNIGAAPAGYVTSTYYCVTNDEIDSAINAIYSSMGDYTVKHIVLGVNAGGLYIPGGTWTITLYRTDSDYGFLEGKCYTGSGFIRKVTRLLYGGVWGAWVDESGSNFAASNHRQAISTISDVNISESAPSGTAHKVWIQPMAVSDYLSKLGINNGSNYLKVGDVKICWGTATTSSSADPAGVYSVKVTLPITMSSNSYTKVVTRHNSSGSSSKDEPAYSYYEITTSYFWIGSKLPSLTVNWIAIGT